MNKIGKALIFYILIIAGCLNGMAQNCLVAQYDFNGNANDTTGHGHNGTVSGATLMPDRFNRQNQAYSFDGLNDEITVPDHSDLEGFSEMTIVLWAHFTNYNDFGSDKVLLQKWAINPVVMSDRCYLLAYDSLNNWVQFKVALNGVLTNPFVDFAYTDIPLNKWMMITGVFTGDSLRIYLDTFLKKQLALGGNYTLRTGNAPLAIGREQTVAEYSKVRLDDIKIFNCALSSSQIDSIFKYDPFVCNLDTTLSHTADTLWSNEIGAKYSWIKCNGSPLLPGDTLPYYIPVSNGSYSVIIEKLGCIDTSACITVSNVGIIESVIDDIHIYPIPAKNLINIDLQKNRSDVIIRLYNHIGQVVKSQAYSETQFIELKISAPTGFYFLNVSVDGIDIMKQLVIE